tara:strand:+ start:1939 stop:3636 length:1698 start_codon:yes stop_codon:yes gene_type:complete
MCGIHGFNYSDSKKINRMIEASNSRGPDGNGSYSDNNITLGHNLLAITEHSGSSKQPWILNDRFVLCYNGEIYNYEQLRLELKSNGETFETDSDTEVLAKGLRSHGINFIHRLEGMYAIAWYDKHEGTLVLARDAAGAKPLYTYIKDDKLVFSSSIKSLSAAGINLSLASGKKIKRKWDDSIPLFYPAAPQFGTATLLEDVNKLYSGQIIKYKLNNLQKIVDEHTHRKIVTVDKPIDYEEFRHNVSESVKMCLMGRRPIGLYLSGGLDSSMILHELVQYENKPKTFTTRFEYSDDGRRANKEANSDADVAQQLSKHYGTDHTELFVTEQNYIDSFEDTVWAMEEPFENKSTPAYYALNKIVSENGIVVTLAGDGGDEVFTGYRKHLTFLKMHPDELKSPDWFPSECLPDDLINSVLYQECLGRVADDFLIRNDKLGMNFSMEARFPLTIRKFREYALSIPSKYKIQNSETKVIPKVAYKGLLPDYVINKHKTGWSTPKFFLFNKNFRDWAMDILSPDYYTPTESLFNSSGILDLFAASNRDYKTAQKCLGSIAFKIWAKLFKVSI